MEDGRLYKLEGGGGVSAWQGERWGSSFGYFVKKRRLWSGGGGADPLDSYCASLMGSYKICLLSSLMFVQILNLVQMSC